MHKRYRHTRWFKHVPTQESIRAYRFLKPISRFLDHHALWQFNRRSVAGGLGIGLFFSMASPVAQIPLAAIAAIIFRVNLPIAVFGTLLSNPFTTPAILYAAYKLGAWMTGRNASAEVALPTLKNEVDTGSIVSNAMAWLSNAVDWIQAAGLPLAIGLGVLSILAGIAGYVGVTLIWRMLSGRRWKTRCAQRRQARIR